MTIAPSRSISGEVITAARTQRMFSRSRRRAASRNLAISNCFHAESFHDAIAGDRFLNNLARVAQARLAVFRRAANFAPKFADRKNDQRQQNAEPSAMRQFNARSTVMKTMRVKPS